MQSEKIIWVIDDHKLRREGIVGLLRSWAKTRSVQLRQIEAPEHIYPSEFVTGEKDLFQLCLMGIGGRSLSEPEVEVTIRQLMEVLDGRPLVVILDNSDDAEVKHALKLGVKGLVPTYLDSGIAARAISFVLEGGVFFPSHHQRHCNPGTGEQHDVTAPRNQQQLDDGNQPASDRDNRDHNERQPASAIPVVKVGKLPELSERQMDVLEALKRGHSNKLIARALNLSEATVKIHMRTLI